MFFFKDLIFSIFWSFLTGSILILRNWFVVCLTDLFFFVNFCFWIYCFLCFGDPFIFLVIFEFLLLLPLCFLLLSYFKVITTWSIKRAVLGFMLVSFIWSLFFITLLPNPLFMENNLLLSNLWTSIAVFSDFYTSNDPLYFIFSNYFFVDGISIFFVLLTTFIFPLCVVISWYNLQDNVSLFLFLLVVLEFFVVNCFLLSNIFFFFICFEAILFPMFFIIGLWGSRDRKIHAGFQFLLYTLVGSFFFYVALFFILLNYDSLDYNILKLIKFSAFDQNLLFILLFSSFSFKIPLFPVHIWLPEAHVEAPTVGSVILAGLLLKLGTYGILRFVIPLFPLAVSYFSPVIFTIVLIGIFYTSFSTVRQLDLKKIIAYSSVGHMGFVILGLFCLNVEGISGSLYLMLGHGLVSSALFICIGELYDRYHTRSITDLYDIARFMPIFSVFFFIITLANISFPGTVNFVAEISILMALAEINIYAVIIALFSIVFILIYSMWATGRVLFVQFSWDNQFSETYVRRWMDLSLRSFFIIFLFIFLIIFFGIFPNSILNLIRFSCEYVVAIYYQSLI